VCESVEEACALSIRHLDADDAVLAAGSIYVAGAARGEYRRLLA
jgi:folylpolyglutamate synthase/dihydropteroate synthase